MFIMQEIETFIIVRISGIMWLKGVVWTLSALLFSNFGMNIKIIRKYIINWLAVFYDLACGVVSYLWCILRCAWGVNGTNDLRWIFAQDL